MTINNIVVIGAGTMGNGIAQTAAVAGYQVTMTDVVPEALESGKSAIAKSIEKLASKGKINQTQKEAALNIRTDLRWIDNTTFLCLSGSGGSWTLKKGVIGGALVPIISPIGDFISFDFDQ
jgi:D-arabinose 1-dehydrogenase-like Zn-dependent alcohol dehydrogenase